ncbi:FAD-binding oxidoreductase [Verticiella sediminum]|uniref:FAD-binding oxidoreductase n=1 Tax=Verticiella sediminum TaxID=1247510 RepID=A0A556AIG2_9BURK|nr:FAD-binding oxidoreductase [Verticiella sediminum]TSH92669.1 FAD-binding oxidoreductase [Verticiella sediminum]
MSKSIIVLGAGMVGVCTALHLQRLGYTVCLVDRREPGRETSYGNAGLIQREAVEPYPFPREFGKILRVALRRGFDIRYHWAALPTLMPRLAGYWSASAPARYRDIVPPYARLILHAIDEHRVLMEAADCLALARPGGYRAIFSRADSFALATARAERLERDWGVHSAVESAADLRRAQPMLAADAVGAVHWQDPWSVVDPGALVTAYATLFVRQGGEVRQGDAQSLRGEGAGWAVETVDGVLTAQQAVLALGPWADGMLRRLGYRLPLFVKRGYHRHYVCARPPSVPLQDADRGFMMSPMRAGLRVATGAEFASLGARATPLQMTRAESAARRWLDLGEAVEPEPWLGARPCTADMLPLIGPAPRHPGLWFNFGHGHQGFTLGPISGRLLAEMLDGASPVVDPAPYAPSRYA